MTAMDKKGDKSQHPHNELARSIAFYRERLEEAKMGQWDIILENFTLDSYQLLCVQIDIDKLYKDKLDEISKTLCRVQTEFIALDQRVEASMEKLRKACQHYNSRQAKRRSVLDRRVHRYFPEEIAKINAAYEDLASKIECDFEAYFIDFLARLEKESVKQLRSIYYGICFTDAKN
jgi:hypothetical protein